MTAFTMPVDVDSPDRQILEGYERTRATRARHYSFDGAPYDPDRDALFEREDVQQIEDENQVFDNYATTIPGVIARLWLNIPSLDQSRWVDRGLMMQGFAALYSSIKDADYSAQQIAHAARELIDIDWGQKLAAYEKSFGDYNAALKLKSAIEAQGFQLRAAGVAPNDLHVAAGELCNDLERRLCDDDAIRDLLRTLAPDREALQRKTEIMRAEGYEDYAAVWIARDAFYLSGRLEEPANSKGDAA